MNNLIALSLKKLIINNIPNPDLDLRILLNYSSKSKKEIFLSNFNDKDIDWHKFHSILKRRLNFEPISKIINKKNFWKYDFYVDNNVLDPRPETELIIEESLKLLSKKNKKFNILDIGTGSGCLTVCLAKEFINSRITAIDISSKAVKTAKLNSKKFNLHSRSKFRVINMDNFNIGKYDLIVSNPPYIALKDIKNLSKDIINYEPLIALKGGFDGLDLIKKVIYKSKCLLKNNGLLGIEIGANQYMKVSHLLRIGGFREVNKVYDCNDNVRCIITTKT